MFANVDELVTYVRRIHNAETDDNWSDAEIYRLAEGRVNEMITIFGLIEATYSESTVASQANYSWPTDTVAVKRLEWNGIPLKRLSRRQYESRNPSGIIPEGDPREYWMWNNEVFLTPIPSSVKTLKWYIEKKQSTITDASDVLDVPGLLHGAIADGVIAMMYAKDLNSSMYDRFENKWIGTHLPAARKYVRDRRRKDGSTVIADADTLLETENGLI